MRLAIPVVVLSGLLACGLREPSEIRETDSETDSGTDSVSESDSQPGIDLPSATCLNPEPGQLCLTETGFLFSVIKPSSVLVEDLDGDELLDVIAISVTSSLVRVAPGQGGGGFGDWIDSELSGSPRGAALGQLDGDGQMDLLLASLAVPAGTGLAFGDGTGMFEPPLFKPTGVAPRAVSLGWIDDDEWLDVAVAEETGNQVFVLLGDGLGGLTTLEGLPVGLEPYDLVLGDLDLDQILDIATVDQGANTISVVWGVGDGTFSAVQTEPVGAGPRGITASDLDGDGDLDLLSADFDADTLSILINSSEVQPRTFAAATTLAVGDSPYAVAAGDITGDGLPDIVSADSGAAQISVFASLDGQNGYAPAVAFEVGYEPFDLALADLDGDGRLDVLSADFGSGGITLLTTGP